MAKGKPRTINPAWETAQGQLAQLDEWIAGIEKRAPTCGEKWARKTSRHYREQQQAIRDNMPPQYLGDE